MSDLLDLHRSGIRNDVILACPVCNFCYGINTDTKALNFNHAGFWSGECLAVGPSALLTSMAKPSLRPSLESFVIFKLPR